MDADPSIDDAANELLAAFFARFLPLGGVLHVRGGRRAKLLRADGVKMLAAGCDFPLAYRSGDIGIGTSVP